MVDGRGQQALGEIRAIRAIVSVTYMLVFWVVLVVVKLMTCIFLILRLAHITGAPRGQSRRPRVLYLAAFFPGNAGYEERVHSWARILRQMDFDTQVRWCLGRRRFEDLLRARRIAEFQLAFLFKRIWHCLAAVRFDAVIVRRELLLYNDYGGLFMEQFLLALNPNVALDFDDDIGAAKREPRRIGAFGRLMLESGSKFADSLRFYGRFIVGSSYLESMVRAHNPLLGPADIAIVPTCVDPAQYPLKQYTTADGNRHTVFGWIGSVGNLRYLDLVLPALETISREHSIKLIVISGEAFERDTSFEIVNVPWSYRTQGDSLNLIEVGLMPLYDGPQQRGKCGFKLIQYMACGIVSVASAVTTNVEIIQHGVNGFLVWRDRDWEHALREVLGWKDRFHEIGRHARETVESRYSFDANRAKYAEFMAGLSSPKRGSAFGPRGRPYDKNGRAVESETDLPARRH